VLHVSSGLAIVAGLCGVFSIALGVVHIAIPTIVRYRVAIGTEAVNGAIGDLLVGPIRYSIRRSDLVGLAWVMSNAASYALITIGIIDLGWAFGRPPVPMATVAWWVAGWWAVRAGSQLTLGRRWGDLVVVGAFAGVALVHVVFALTA
jgi:hypothetical protein